jgi:hypothetical protein
MISLALPHFRIARLSQPACRKDAAAFASGQRVKKSLPPAMSAHGQKKIHA